MVANVIRVWSLVSPAFQANGNLPPEVELFPGSGSPSSSQFHSRHLAGFGVAVRFAEQPNCGGYAHAMVAHVRVRQFPLFRHRRARPAAPRSEGAPVLASRVRVRPGGGSRLGQLLLC
jgi:hypothetical protein